MNPVDLERLKGHQQELFHIAESLESMYRRNNGLPFSRLPRVVAEMHDHQAEIMVIIELNSRRMEAEADFRAANSDRMALDK